METQGFLRAAFTMMAAAYYICLRLLLRALPTGEPRLAALIFVGRLGRPDRQRRDRVRQTRQPCARRRRSARHAGGLASGKTADLSGVGGCRQEARVQPSAQPQRALPFAHLLIHGGQRGSVLANRSGNPTGSIRATMIGQKRPGGSRSQM